jgi:hypothetical protein
MVGWKNGRILAPFHDLLGLTSFRKEPARIAALGHEHVYMRTCLGQPREQHRLSFRTQGTQHAVPIRENALPILHLDFKSALVELLDLIGIRVGPHPQLFPQFFSLDLPLSVPPLLGQRGPLEHLELFRRHAVLEILGEAVHASVPRGNIREAVFPNHPLRDFVRLLVSVDHRPFTRRCRGRRRLHADDKRYSSRNPPHVVPLKGLQSSLTADASDSTYCRRRRVRRLSGDTPKPRGLDLLCPQEGVRDPRRVPVPT